MHRVSIGQLERFAYEWIENLEPASKRATIIGLSGELGAGKTTFVQHLGRQLGVEQNITSPTFIIMKKYPALHSSFSQLFHIDAYRLSGGEELEVLGWSDFTRDPGNLVMVEWPEHIRDLIPPDTLHLSFSLGGESQRYIEEENR